MQVYLTQITNYLLKQSWQIAILVVIVAMINWILRNKSSHVRYLLWMIVLAKCLMPPLVTIPVAILPKESPPEQTYVMPATETTITANNMFQPSESERLVPQSIYEPESPTPVISEKPVVKLTIRQGLGMAWFIGVVIYITVLIIKALRIELWLKRKKKPLSVLLQVRIEDVFCELGLKKFPKIWLVEGIGQPFVWGILRGGIYLPSDFTKVNNNEQQHGILGHELCHIIRFDATINLLQIITQGIFWFHPFVWWANKKIRAEREKCCDEMTIARLGAKAKEYSKAIVNILIISEHKNAQKIPSLAIVGPVKNIEERIKIMLTPGKKFYRHPSIIAATTIIIIALLTVPTALVLTSQAHTATTTESVPDPSVESLHEAVGLNNVEEVKRLIAGGADVNAKNARGFAPLNWGIYQSSLSREVVELLIDAGADVNAQDDTDGLTALHGAIYVDMGMDMVTLLVDKGADVNLTTKKGWTPLHYAVDMENLDAVRLLVDRGAASNVKNQEGWTPFSRAALYGRTDMTQLFLAKGADTSSLHMAAFTGDLSRVRELIETGTDIDTKDEFGWTALFWAACSGQTNVAEFLIENKADLNAQDGTGRSLLHQAAQAQTDAAKLVELLIAKGADVNAKNANGEAPLILACNLGNKNVAEVLIAKGADVNAKNNIGETALHRVALTNHVDVAELLVSKGADVNAETNIRATRYTPLHGAAMRDAAMVKFLIEHGADINACAGSFGRTAFHQAVIMGKTDIVKLLIEKGADINSPDRMPGITPLAWAVRQGHTEIVELLLSKGANVNATDSTGLTPLDMAEERGNAKIITLLREHGAEKGSPTLLAAVTSGNIEQVKSLISEETDPNAKNASLQEACSVGQLEIVKLLIENGADVNARSQRGPALYRATMANHSEIVELLISNGADINMKNSTGRSFLHFACQRGNKEIAELLIDNGADIDAKDNGDYTALIRSTLSSQKDIVEFLLDKGADIEAKQEHGATALACAAYDGNTEMVGFLLEHGANIEAKLYDEETTPLIRAIVEGHLETVALLLDKGADAQVKQKGFTTLQLAMIGSGFANKNSNPEIVKLLLQHGLESPQIHLAACFGDIKKIEDYLKDGTKINEKDTANFTALHYAVSGGHEDVVKFLLSNGANVNAKSVNGWTPLRFTLTAKMAELLITNGADVNISDNKGQTVLHGAVNQDHKRGNKELVELLVKHGADVNAKAANTAGDWAGWTPLHIACQNGNLEIVKLLIEHGADIDAKTDKGETPLSIAQANNRRAVVQLLREHGAEE